MYTLSRNCGEILKYTLKGVHTKKIVKIDNMTSSLPKTVLDDFSDAIAVNNQGVIYVVSSNFDETKTRLYSIFTNSFNSFNVIDEWDGINVDSHNNLTIDKYDNVYLLNSISGNITMYKTSRPFGGIKKWMF